MYSNLQIESLKRVYDAIIEFLHEFYKTGGFTTALWYEFYHKGVKDPVDAIYDYVENQLDKVHLVLQKECFLFLLMLQNLVHR